MLIKYKDCIQPKAEVNPRIYARSMMMKIISGGNSHQVVQNYTDIVCKIE